MAGPSNGHFVRRTLKLINNLLKSEGTISKILPELFSICIAVRSSSGRVGDESGQISYTRAKKLTKIPASHMNLFPFPDPSECGSQILRGRHATVKC